MRTGLRDTTCSESGVVAASTGMARVVKPSAAISSGRSGGDEDGEEDPDRDPDDGSEEIDEGEREDEAEQQHRLGRA